MLILMVTFGQQYDCTAGDLVMGISGLPRVDGVINLQISEYYYCSATLLCTDI